MTKKIIAIALLGVLVSAPSSAAAATYYQSAAYYNMSDTEKLAFLYGMIAQLQALLELTERYENGGGTVVGEPRPGNNRADIEVTTLSAIDVEDNEATLRARIDLDGEDEAEVWFEYGTDDDDLDDDSRVLRVTDRRGDIVTVEITIDDLDEDERYYFRAIAEDENGDRDRGSVRYFTTDDNATSRSNDDYRLTVSDSRISEGERVEIEWEIPSDERGTKNWIGLYEVGDNNRDYIDWKYLANDDEGVVSFRIQDEGEYEFRLFLDDSYNDEITIGEVEVD